MIDGAMTPWGPLFEQSMRNLLKAEGFPDKEGWSPQFKVTEDNTGIKIKFTDEKSKAWFRHWYRAKKVSSSTYTNTSGT